MTTSGAISQKDIVLNSAATFRQLLDCAARPGKLNSLPLPIFLGAPPLRDGSNTAHNLYALGAMLTLLDAEVSFAVAEQRQWLDINAPLAQWLALRSGAKLVAPDAAAFAFFAEGNSFGRLAELSQGTLLEPENSATAFYCVDELGGGELELELSGPGILETNRVAMRGMATEEIGLIKATRQQYPLGIDVYLIDRAGRCLGLPRTTRIEIND